MGWFSSSSKPVCHFCQSHLSLISPDLKGKANAPRGPFGWDNSPNAFLCGVCDSWNTTDNHGRLSSEPPRWIDPRLDWKPFDPSVARPPRTPTSSSPTTFASTASPHFCRTCLSNQSLQAHLLASFPLELPGDPAPPSPPLSPELSLAEYRARLDRRYPLLCAACAPGVQDAIKTHDYKAKAWALGNRLTQSSVRGLLGAGAGGAQRGQGREGEWRWFVTGVVWRVRGVGWWATQVGAVGVSALTAAQPDRLTWSSSLRHGTFQLQRVALPVALLSVAWAFWDPTWLQARHERARGRRLDVHGRATFVALQALAYALRLALVVVAKITDTEDTALVRRVAVAGLAVFLMLPILSLRSISLRPPPRVRLASSHKIQPPPRAPPPPEDVLEALSLSSSPPPSAAYTTASTLRLRAPARAPIFGAFAPSPAPPAPQLAQAAVQAGVPLVPDSMEWEPSAAAAGEGVRLARPRFWPDGARGTGLEERMGSGMVLSDADGKGVDEMEVEVKEGDGDAGVGGVGGWWRWS